MTVPSASPPIPSIPLTSAQRRIWFAEQRGVGAAYVLDASLRLAGRIDTGVLALAFGRLLVRHPMLTVRAAADSTGSARQWLDPDTGVRLEQARAEDEDEALRLAEAHLARPLDLVRGPVLSPLLVRVRDDLSYLAIGYHHLAGDGIFSQVLREDLMAEYAAVAAAGRNDCRPPDPPGVPARDITAEPFAELVDAELGTDAVARVRRDVHHTTARLHGGPATSTLHPDRTRVAAASGAASWVELDCGDRLADRVAEFARRHRVTPFVVHSLVLHLLVQRYAAQRDTLVGFMSGGRSARHRRAGGLHAATLVQRLDLSDEPGVAEALARLRADLVLAQRYGSAPLELLAEHRGEAGLADRHPVFQVMLNYVDECPPIRAGGIVATPVIVPARLSWLDLEVRLHPSADHGLRGFLRAPLDLYDESTVERAARCYRHLLDQVVAHPERAVSGLALLDRPARAATVAAGTGPRRAAGASLWERIVDRVRLTPDAPAVHCGPVRLTFAEVLDQARAVAAALDARGVGPSSVVAVCAERSAELVSAVLGVSLAGAALLPLDTEQPSARSAFMLDDTGAACVLLSRATAACWDVDGTPRLVIDDIVTGPAPPTAGPPPGTRAYVLYTSGSTGRPKAVVSTREGLGNRLSWMCDQLGVGERDVILHKTPYTFDVSMWEFFLPFVTGARLVVAPPDAHRDPGWLAEIIADEAVTVVHFVPSMLRVFERSGELAELTSLRHIVCSGEALPADLAGQVLDASGAELWNFYGPTEASIDVTSYGCRRHGLPHRAATVPIGWPVDNTTAVVLDRYGGMLPHGAVGELHLGGMQLAEGYLNRPELTAERFVPAPADLAVPGGPPGATPRLYRTGDLARVGPAGAIEYLGRTDRQLKLRGVRVEPGEIEAALRALDGVVDAVVLAGSDVLVGYVRCSADLTAEGVAAGLTATLPPHLVPARYHLMREFPLLPSGKVDRNALSELDSTAPPRPAAEPLSETEARILAAMGAVLDRSGLGVDDSFFAAGGDSLRSIELVARCRATGVELDVSDVFTNPTARRLAVLAREVAGLPATAEPFSLVPRDGRMPVSALDAVPLGSALAGLVVESTRPDRYRVYVTSLLVRADFDRDRLERAVARAVRRHPMLRAALWRAGPGDEPVLLVHDTVNVPVTVHDLTEVADADRVLDRFHRDEPSRGFDWYLPPLCRFTVHLLAGGRFQLTLTEPFLDGYSASLVLRDVLEGFAVATGEVSTAVDSPAAGRGAGAVADHVRAEREAQLDPVARRFWLDHLAGAPSTRVEALDRAGEPVELAAVEVALDRSVTAALTALGRSTGIPLKSMLLAAHVRAVATLCAQRDVCVGLMANARPETADGSTAAGLFLNVNALRVPIAPGSWWDLVRQVHAAEAETLPHRRFPFAELRREGVPEVGTLFNFTHFRAYAEATRSFGVDIVGRWANDQTYLPLTAQFGLDALDGRVRVRLEFFGARLPAALRDTTAAVFVDAVRAVAAEPHGRHDRRALGLARPDPTGLLADRAVPPAQSGQDSPTAVTAVDRTVVDLLADTAAAHPGRPATVGADRTLDFGGLWDRSRRLAGALAAAGVRPGDPVAVELPRSSDLVVALFGVLAAGGRYTPVDPAWPAARRSAVLAGAGCTVIVTRGAAPAAVTAVRPDHDGEPLARSRAVDAGGFLVFTSGSTGTPRGVRLPHRAMTNRIRWYLRHAPLSGADRLCARAPIGFVDSLAELLTGPCGGAPTHLLDGVDDPGRLVAELGRCGISRLTLVPSQLAAVLDLDVDLARELPRLRYLTVSGETFPTDLARRVRARLPNTVVDNFYGSTEVAADACHYRLTGAERGPTVPIGRPIDGVRAFPADPWGNPVPPGVVGELRVGGACLADGYWNDPPGTARRFTGPAGAADRVFATGDLARLDVDRLVHLGRTDRQIKIRGVRVEPAGVEATLRTLPTVRDAAVTVDPAGTQLRAFLVLADPASRPEVDEVRTRLVQQLPAAAVPERFAVLDELPRTASGKVDHRRLPHTADWLHSAVDSAGPPRTVVELELSALWRRVLGATPADTSADFFDLGANSLHAVMLGALVEDQFGVTLSVAELFDTPTLWGQARLVEERFLRAPHRGPG